MLRDVAMANIFGFYFFICGADWHHPANTTEPSMCGGDAALCQITLTACFLYSLFRTRLRGVGHAKKIWGIWESVVEI